MYDTIQKTIAAWAFNHYIAYYYFDNVNVSQLKVAFEKGEVELENLPIKRDAPQHFSLPYEVKSGVVGRLSIKVPLLKLLTDPWIIKISDIMLIVQPKKHQTSILNGKTSRISADESIASNGNDHIDGLVQDTLDTTLAESTDNSILEDETDEISVNSEETKLAELCSSFSASVATMVRDIYKNIRLEIESMTVIFDDFDHGLAKFSVKNLLIHRPKSIRKMIMEDVSIYLSGIGADSSSESDDMLRVNIKSCELDIFDDASNNMQLVMVQPQDSAQKGTQSTEDQQHPVQQPKTISETKIEGILTDVSTDLLMDLHRRSGDRSVTSVARAADSMVDEDILLSKRNILKCDRLKLEFKLNNNIDEDLIKLFEKNLHIKLDLIGMQYIHSQRIYELTTRRLMNLLKFFIKLQSKQTSEKSRAVRRHGDGPLEDKKSCEKRELSFNKLLNFNIEEGLVYIIDDTSGTSAIPLLEFSFEECRILQFSGRNQQNGFVFAKIGCNYYNREASEWDPLLRAWPFNISWDFNRQVSSANQKRKLIQHRQIQLTSDELAEFILSSAFFDLSDVALKKVVENFAQTKFWAIATTISKDYQSLSLDYDSIFVIHNETGHKLEFAPIEHSCELFESSTQSSPTFGQGGDSTTHTLIEKLSINSRSSIGSRDSPELSRLVKWTSIGERESISFEFETLPVYRRYLNDISNQSRVLLVRVDGWKTLLPIPINRTGVFFREARSDRVMNEDTYIVVSVELEETSARKLIHIRSPLKLINLLDTTMEIHFEEVNQTLYIKPDGHLAVPLPYMFNRIHIRPCNVGVTMSEKPLLWDNLLDIAECKSSIQKCHPISVTNRKHASYCTSQPYRICVSTKRDGPTPDEDLPDAVQYPQIPVFTMSFIPPLTVVNLLPCKISFFINNIEGNLDAGGEQKIYHVDTTKSTEIHFKMAGFPQSKPINIDTGATGSFQHTLEMVDRVNRSLYLNAKIILESSGEEPAVKVIVSAQFWFINKTRLPLIFKQEGAALEAAGQFREHEDSSVSTLLFSFYDTELEPPWLCCMRLGKSKGTSMWSEGFKLEKGSGERRINFIPVGKDGAAKQNKSLIDINISRGYGRYSDTMIVTLKARYGFDPLTKTPKKNSIPSPQNYKLTSYNHNANLAERIASQAVTLFSNQHVRHTSDVNLVLPGFKLTLVDNSREKLIDASVTDISVVCTTKIKEQILDVSIQDVRIQNVMSDCEKSIMLDRPYSLDTSINAKPAIRLIMDRIMGNSLGTTLFRQVQLSVCELVLNIEEKLILKLVEFISFRGRNQKKRCQSQTHDLDKILNPEDDRISKYYFDLLRIDLTSLKLSVLTTTNLTNSLQKIKNYLGLKFFGFEDAQVQLSPYFKMNVSQTFKGVFESVTRFYKRQILEQAPRIVGQQIQNYLRFHLSDMLSTLYDEVYNKMFN